MSSSLVVLQASDLQQLNFLHQGNTRLKVVCFDLSPSFILLGANSGTIYVLDHETLHLKKQIPAGNGSVMQLNISPDEQQVACALSCGTVMVFELQLANTQLLTSSLEHRGQTVTTLVWAFCRPELYIGDASGRITMLYASKSKTATLFRSSCLHLMTLESGIIQLDYQESYLLVSTLTHSYVCNTSSETFSQVGTKLRQGEYGACFCQVNPSGTASPHREPRKGVEDLQASLTSSSEKFGLSDCYEAIEEEHTYRSSSLRRERPGRTESPMLMSHVFCARPGTRIWEADHSGKVLVTHQLKNALMVPPAEVLFTDGSFGEQHLLEVISLLPETDYPTGDKLSGHKPTRSSTAVKATHPPVSVTFTKMMSFYNKYLLAISAYGLYIIDPATSKVLIWVSVSEGITDVKVSGNSLIYKSGNGCIQNFMITTVDIAILVLHTRKLFLECASLCLKNKDVFAKSELLSRLGAKILTDLSNNISSDIIQERIKGLRLFADIDKERNHSMNLTKISGVTYIKNKSFEAEEIKANLNVALKRNHVVLSNLTVTRWNSEPHLGRSQVEWDQLPAAHGTMSMESSPVRCVRKNKPQGNTPIYLHEAPGYPISTDKLPNRPTKKYMGDLTSTSLRSSVSSGPNHDLEKSTAPSSDPCSQQSDAFSPQKSLESSIDMFEDPLFTPEDSPSPDHEAASRVLLDRHPPPTLLYAAHNFYNLAYAPIHPGSEAATLLQDLMENVTTNVVDTFTSGTRTLTERLKSVVPLVSPQRSAEGVTSEFERTRNHPNTDSDLPLVTPMKNTDTNDDLPHAIVIQASSRKKQPQRQVSLLTGSGSTHGDLEEAVIQPELPGVVRNLHELVCTTVHQMTTINNPEEAQHLLGHWFKVFCKTVEEIQVNNTNSSLPPSEDQAGEGPVSLSSIESPHSVGSADTSSDSLHWDPSDIGFEPSSLSIDILEKISGLFLESLQVGVTVSNLHLTCTTPQKTDLPHHPMTPSDVRKRDALYAQVIASDCGLLQYSHLLNALDSLGHNYYTLTWAALMEKITRNSNTLPSQPLPDIIPDLEFTRAQWVSILHSVASSGSTKNLITTAAQIESPLVIQDVIFLLQYMTTHQVEMNCSLSRTQIPKLLLQYMTECSHYRSLTKTYLDSWCLYSELQGDILGALLSVTSPVPSHFSCKCGLPMPYRRHVALEVLEEIILLHDIADPKGLAEMCQSLGYWKGYCAINLAYCLQSHTQLFPYVLQTCNANLLNNFLEVIHRDDFGMAFSTLAKVSSKDISIMLCFRCQSKIPFPGKEEFIIEDSMTRLNHEVIMNGNSCLTENSFNITTEASSKKLTDDQLSIHEAAGVVGMSQLWEVVVGEVLRRSGAANTLHLLTKVQDIIPPGVINKRVFNWCILASLAEQRGPAACWTLLDSLCGTRTNLYSHKVFQAIHRRPSSKCQGNQTDDMTSKETRWSTQLPDTAHNGTSPPPPNIISKDPRHSVPLGHHWGVWADVLEGMCSCCHLRLSTQALVSEGGITVFSCSHAFHAICLSHRGYECVQCAQPQPFTAIP